MDERLEELTEDLMDDVRRVSEEVTARAKHRTQQAATESAPAGGMALAGLVVAAVGGLMFLALPVVPRRNRAVRRRMIGTSILYLAGGGAIATIGTLAVRDALRRSGRRATRELRRTASEVRQHVERGARS